MIVIRAAKQIVTLCLLLSSEASKYSRAPITFQQIGEMSPDVAEFVMVGRIEVDTLTSELKKVSEATKWMKDTNAKIPKSKEQTLIQRQLRILHYEVRDLGKRARSLETLVEEGRVKTTRPKRAIGMILGGVALVGAAIGSIAYTGYLGSRIDKLEATQSSMLHYVDLTAELAASNQKRIAALNITLQAVARHEMKFEAAVADEIRKVELAQRLALTLDTCEEILSHITSAIIRLTMVWTSALQGRISLDLIPPETAAAALKKIREGLPDGTQMAIEQGDLTSFYRLPCHLIARAQGYVIAIPIPVYKSRDVFSLYRYLPTPVATGGNLEMLLNTEGSYLAINRERTLHAELTVAELQSCLHVEELYLCPQRRVFHKSSEPSCLYLLFQGKIEEAQRSCSHAFRFMGDLDVIQMSRTTYIVVSSRTTTITQSCGEGSQSEDLTIEPGTRKLELEAGCSLNAESLYVVPAGNQTELADTFTVDTGEQLPLDLDELMQDLYPHLDLPMGEIENITQALTQVGATVTLSEVLAARQKVQVARHTSWSWFLVTEIIGIVLGVFGVFLCCCVIKRQRKQRVQESAKTLRNRKRKSNEPMAEYRTIDASRVTVNVSD